MAKRKSAIDHTPRSGSLVTLRNQLTAYRAQSPAFARSVLAIDPGTANLALCALSETEYRTSKIALPKFDLIADTVRYVEEVILCWILETTPDLIVKEGPAHFSKFGVADAGRVQYAIERLAFEMRIPLITIAPMTMRAFVGSSGKDKTKSDTKLELFKTYGVEFTSEDEADAYGLARTGIAIAHGNYTPGAKRPKAKKLAA